jgi:hypothetical protein
LKNPLVGLGLIAGIVLIAFAIMDAIKHKNDKIKRRKSKWGKN